MLFTGREDERLLALFQKGHSQSHTGDSEDLGDEVLHPAGPLDVGDDAAANHRIRRLIIEL